MFCQSGLIFLMEYAKNHVLNTMNQTVILKLTYQTGIKKVNRKVQGVPQSQTAANLHYQEEEQNDKN